VPVSEKCTAGELFLCGCKAVEKIECSYCNVCPLFHSFTWNIYCPMEGLSWNFILYFSRLGSL